MNTIQIVLEEIAENFEKRRFEITNLRRILLCYVGKPLESTAVRMAIPLLYANWEGYVKEVCQLYLEFIETTGLKYKDLKAELLGYSWTSALRPLTGGLNLERKKSIAELALYSMEKPVCFTESEGGINTKSNLNYKVLVDILNHLCLDSSVFNVWKHHINAFVNLRNNIAHGSIPSSLNFDTFEENSSTVIILIEEFEKILIGAVENRDYCTNKTS